MKKLYTFLLFGGLFAGSFGVNAQSMSVAHDTVYISTGASAESHNDILNLTSGALTLQWKVSNTNFPADWLANTGICDNGTCISGAGLWTIATSTGTAYDAIYPVSTTAGTFKVQVDLATSSLVTSNGTYFLRVLITNKFGAPSDTVTETYIVTRNTSSVSTVKMVGDIAIYPNPATNTLNMVYDASSDVKNIAIFNIIGKQMNIYRTKDNNSASLNIEGFPTGIYFARLLNSRGDVVATRKFTKQ